MITLRPAAERGHANHGWLDSWHSFSFADYRDDKHVHWGPLRVVNEDRVQPGEGFWTHSHRDMEIISYVLDGSLGHKDSMGNAATTAKAVRPTSCRYGSFRLKAASNRATSRRPIPRAKSADACAWSPAPMAAKVQ